MPNLHPRDVVLVADSGAERVETEKVVIPESLLAHDDVVVTSTTTNNDADLAPPSDSNTPPSGQILLQEADVTTKEVPTEICGTEKEKERQEDKIDSITLGKDKAQIDVAAGTPGYETLENKYRATEDTDKESANSQKSSPSKLKGIKGKMTVPCGIKSGKENVNDPKETTSKLPRKNVKKTYLSPKKQEILKSTESPRRPRRTVQLPARLAESDHVIMNRKRTSVSDEHSPNKRLHFGDKEEENCERTEQEQSLDAVVGETECGLGERKRKRKRGRPRLRKEGSTSSRKTAAKQKDETEKTLACPVCAKLMKEYENVFDHVKKYHEEHPEFFSILGDLKVNKNITLVQKDWHRQYVSRLSDLDCSTGLTSLTVFQSATTPQVHHSTPTTISPLNIQQISQNASLQYCTVL